MVEGEENSQVEVIKNHSSNHLKRRFTSLLNLKKIPFFKGSEKMKKFLILTILVMTSIVIVWANSITELSPIEAVSHIENALFKKGLKNLTVNYGDVIDSDKHNIFIEFGAQERSLKEGVYIIYEAALIIGNLQPIMRQSLQFRVNTLRFTKNGKLVSWINADYCAQAIWDDMIEGSFEREQFILSHLIHER